MKKKLCVVIALTMVFLSISACIKQASEESEGTTTAKATDKITTEAEVKEEPLVTDTKITLKVMGDRRANGGAWKNLTLFKTLEEITNIHLEFEDVTSDNFEEKKNLALATGDLPDLFLLNSASLNDNDIETYAPQGYFVALDDLIEEHAPYWKNLFEEYPVFEKGLKASDGKIYALGGVGATSTSGAIKPAINKVWLDNLGLEMPETIEDLYNVLVAFRDDDPNQNNEKDEIPMSGRTFYYIEGTLLPAFGEVPFASRASDSTTSGLYVRDGVVQYYPMNDGFKHYLEFLNRLFEEKLLDNMFLSYTAAEYNAVTEQNIVGFMPARGLADYQQLEIMAPLTSEYNSEKLSASSYWSYNKGGFAITKENDYPMETIKWADLFARGLDEDVNGINGLSLWLGQKGVDWDITDNGYTEYLFTPDEGDNESTHLVKYIAPIPTLKFGLGILPYPFKGGVLEWVGKSNMEKIVPYIKDEMRYSLLINHTPEELDRVSIIRTDLLRHVDEMAAKFVVGEESFDKWDEYISTLISIGVNEYLEIHQRAYDRFIE